MGGHPGEGHLLEGGREVGGRRLEQFSRPATGRSTVRGSCQKDLPCTDREEDRPSVPEVSRVRRVVGEVGGQVGGQVGGIEADRPPDWLRVEQLRPLQPRIVPLLRTSLLLRDLEGELVLRMSRVPHLQQTVNCVSSPTDLTHRI